MNRTKLLVEALIRNGFDEKTANMVADVRNTLYEDAESLIQGALAVAKDINKIKPKAESKPQQKENTQQQTDKPNQEVSEQPQQTANENTGNPVTDTLNHYTNTKTLLKSAITDAIVKTFTDAQQPEIQENGEKIIEKKLYLTESSLQNMIVQNYKCSADQAAQILVIMCDRDFLTKTSRLRTSEPAFQGVTAKEFYMMLPEAIEKYNA